MSHGSPTVTVVVPVRAGEPAAGATDALGLALDLTGDPGALTAVLVGSGTDDAAAALADADFADVAMRLAEAGDFAPGAWAAALAATPTLTDADVVLAAASADGRDLAPRLAAELARPLVAGVVTLDSRRALVPRAAGRAQAEVRITLPLVATCQTGVGAAPRTTIGEPVAPSALEGFAVAGPPAVDATVLEVAAADAATMDLSEAPFIIGVGAGVGTAAAVDTLRDITEHLDASLGATRVVTDEGWVHHDRQIGTTGVVVDPRTYVAFGISGAVQHTAGLGNPDQVISVNTDPHCPMMQLSDLAIVADAPAVITELQHRLATTDEATR